MPRFEPFAGLRYAAADLDPLVAPPYDVISPEEREALEARSPHNAVRLEVPRPGDDGDPYAEAARLLEAWQAEGVLRRDPPGLYGYRMTFTAEDGTRRATTGALGALGLEPPGEGDVLPHERTTPKARSDRLDLLRATGANLSPIWGLSMATGLTAALGEPVDTARATDDDGVVHEVWALPESAASAAAAVVASAPVVVADGHHRFEVALAHQAAQDGRGGHDLVLALVVELAADQLDVRPIHRLVHGIPAGVDLPRALEAFFDVEPTAEGDDAIAGAMAAVGALALVTASGRWLLRPTTSTEAAAERPLDSCRLDVALGALGLEDVSYQHGVDLAVRAVDRGEAAAAVLLRPPPVEQIFATAEARDRMPPKTTFFWPKPRTGMVFRLLDG